ncbi:GAF domain-containing protein [Candidatus Sumerlaeota bacterium]|nr:GAF domain-containing protein [Candidatus Sumerlaeota bacterium]
MAVQRRAKRKTPRSSIHSDRYLQLFEALSPLAGSRSLEDITSAACKMIADLLEVQACSILLHDRASESLTLRGAPHIARSQWRSVSLPVDSGICGHTFSSGKPLLLGGAEGFDAFGVTPNTKYGIPSCIIVPLFVAGQARGVISVANPKGDRRFNERDVRLIEAAARVIAGGIQNAEQFQKTIKVQERLKEIFESLHVGVLALDSELRITHFNQRFRELLGRPRVRLKGRLLRDVLPPVLYGVCQRLIRDTSDKCSVCQERVSETLEDRDLRWEITASRANYSTASNDCLLMISDVGQDEEVRRLREADSVKGAFLRIISHELRTPLTVIRGAMPLLERCVRTSNGSSLETWEKVGSAMKSNVQKLTGLVNTILDVVEIENGSLWLTTQPLDLNHLLREKITFVTTAAKLKNIEWEIDHLADLPEVQADRQRLGQTIYELLDNAIKFSPPGGTIGVATARKGKMATVRISNKGRPIAKKDREGVFDKFYQLDQSTTRRTGGCGLGLYLARNIMLLHHGDVSIVDGKEEDETVFLLKLPLAGENVETH